MIKICSDVKNIEEIDKFYEICLIGYNENN